MIKKLFRRLINSWSKPKAYLLDGKFEIVPAFDFEGETYYMHKNPLDVLAGRGMTSLVFMEEMLMRCDAAYLRNHTAAVDAVLSNPKGTNLTEIVRLNNNLKERTELLVAVPKHLFKLAAVIFFTKSESPYRYDFAAGEAKIKRWEANPDMYDFFLRTPLKALIPSLMLPEQNSKQYLETIRKIDEMHLKDIRAILSAKALKTATHN